MTLCIAGGTGLVGSELIQLLKNHPDLNFVALSRRELTLPANGQALLVDWDQIESKTSALTQDCFVCCLGTTIKEAGSQAAFAKVDKDYVLRFAKIAEKNQVKKLIVVSANGANATSGIFYSRIKGEMEAELKSLKIPQIQILRPSLLIGHRTKSRPGEAIAQAIMPAIDTLLLGPLAKYQSISARQVAQFILKAALSESPGVKIFESNQIKNLELS